MGGRNHSKRFLGSDMKPVNVAPAQDKPEQLMEPTPENITMAQPESFLGAAKLSEEALNAPQAGPIENAFTIEAIHKFMDQPEVGLKLYEQAVKDGVISQAEQDSAMPFIEILKRVAELQKVANTTPATAVKTTESKTEEKPMTTIASKVENATDAAAAKTADLAKEAGFDPKASAIVSAEPSNLWLPTVIAAGTAMATTGFDMVLNDDLSMTRIGGTVASGAVAATIQQIVQRNFTDNQGTGINCGIAVGVGMAAGGLGRVGINMIQERIAADETTEL